MFIKSVVIDGFKSYGTRTEIKGFDPEFNAITGLNGTGKSNILDSICFVLGISNLSHIALGGKNRYMINGSTVTSKFINDFFSSIQLNVNNPHFLIMQGRITKVLNMKPPEILSMIEEAAGTRMYENKKQGAHKIIERKDGTLKEIDEMVTGQINPKMQRLKEERAQYIEFQRIQRELEQLTRIHVAWEYLQSEKTKEEMESKVQQLKDNLNLTKKSISDSTERIKTLELEIAEAQAKRDNESGGLLQELEAKLKQTETLEATLSAKLKSTNDAISNEQKRLKVLQKSVNDDEKALEGKRGELEKVQSVFDKLRETEKQDASALEAAQQKFQAVSSGLLANEDGENATLQDQLMAVKHRLTQAETEIKQFQIQIKHSKSELDTKLPLLKKTGMAFEKDRNDLQMKEAELKSLQERFSRLSYNDGAVEQLQEQARLLSQQVRKCSDDVNNFEYRYPQLQFHYKDPEPNFDRSKVRGLLCKLLTVKDKRFARALETAAGGKLFNVVTENEHTSSKLIEKGQLLRRTTFAPINKIQGSKLHPKIIAKAEQLVGKGNVFPAQDLISYDREYESVMSWAFGQVLICTSMDAAEKVFNHPEIKRKAITVDGDVFDPSGVISGGAVDETAPILLALMEFRKAEQVFSENKDELDKINIQINKLLPIANRYESMKQKIELGQHEIKMVQERLQQTSHYQLQQELDILSAAIKENESKIMVLQQEIQSKSLKSKELEEKMKNLKSVREKEIKEAEAELKRIKKKSDESRKNWKQRENEFETLNLEIKELEKTVENGKDELKQIKQGLSQQELEVEEFKNQLSEAQGEVRNFKDQVKAQKDLIGQSNKEIQLMVNQKEQLIQAIGEKELEILSRNHEIGKYESNISDTIRYIYSMKTKYKWIENDQQYFGQPNGVYDFSKNDPKEAGQKVKRLNEMKDKMGKQLNSKAMDMLSTQEDRFQNVMDKKSMVEEDRSKILSVIEELDLKKDQVIREAWDKVNHDFNSILNSLLPSAEAKLMPVEGAEYLQGLKVKIGFGGIWKESLDELSGGQRSLVALSLILAMLLFKPAPLYILDEVDAALDPSHTQNIGQMLKAHFKQSQFIVVSLKEGMFNNANVLFRTSFVDGMSNVSRTTYSNKNQ
ncbi:structural maintenance of chromosomes 2 isoform X3 [Rhodnius prolixus]|uniref:structural maintenance of chromosomes 2 isoform X3 n=1 Tax=Rhodnius prolixus TaxID=13249 RepID=UPI003D18E8BF